MELITRALAGQGSIDLQGAATTLEFEGASGETRTLIEVRPTAAAHK